MKELSLHILDIIENSVRAKASEIKLEITEDLEENLFEIKIEDNGKGMDEEFAKAIKDPFKTTRTTRKVGLGVPLLVAACNRCNGDVEIQSTLGEGTKLRAWMEHNHIDRVPLGDIVSTITNLIMSNPSIEFIYVHRYNNRVFRIDTQEIKDILGGVPINELSVIAWIKEYLAENLTEIRQKS
ncbi:ATP-binding protein [Defluviitalea saccharophila]|uniref:ATP-binding protein n=1 Tax=Defluviitalea saccharophila TaxID=879970 RepID=A0ABZ2Y578_9FIRM|nr:ATP-binding protein [Candidatus Epulonipiscium sp.]